MADQIITLRLQHAGSDESIDATEALVNYVLPALRQHAGFPIVQATQRGGRTNAVVATDRRGNRLFFETVTMRVV
jgi:hypothetical protein